MLQIFGILNGPLDCKIVAKILLFKIQLVHEVTHPLICSFSSSYLSVTESLCLLGRPSFRRVGTGGWWAGATPDIHDRYNDIGDDGGGGDNCDDDGE